MNKNEFEKIVWEGVSAIPQKFLGLLENVEISIEEEPTPEQKKKINRLKKDRVFGLYEGIPKTKRWNYGQVLPDKITIFQKPIEEIVSSEEEIKEIVKNTVWHEIAHHFGINEEEIQKIEKRKNKNG